MEASRLHFRIRSVVETVWEPSLAARFLGERSARRAFSRFGVNRRSSTFVRQWNCQRCVLLRVLDPSYIVRSKGRSEQGGDMELSEAIRTRRSVRRFADRPVSEEALACQVSEYCLHVVA